MPHRYRNVAIAGTYNTCQARSLPQYETRTLFIDAALGVLDLVGLTPADVDAVYCEYAFDLIFDLGMSGVEGTAAYTRPVPSLVNAANAIAAGQHEVVLVVGGKAGVQRNGATADWTRPTNEFTAPFGMFTTVEYALLARRYSQLYGDCRQAMSVVAATIRNNGNINPDAVGFGRGPYTPADITDSRIIADPLHLLDCALVCEGGAALVITTAERAADLAFDPVYILGAGLDHLAPPYVHAPVWERHAHDPDATLARIGAATTRRAFAAAGLTPDDVDACEFYDPFSFEIIRNLEAFGFVGEGEGADYVLEHGIGIDSPLPITTDGGLMSYSHSGSLAQGIQRSMRGVEQLQRRCATNQVEDAEVVLCSAGGSGSMFSETILLGRDRP